MARRQLGGLIGSFSAVQPQRLRVGVVVRPSDRRERRSRLRGVTGRMKASKAELEGVLGKGVL